VVPTEDPFELWETTVAALAEASAQAQAPIVWVLEDLHAADLGTLDLLAFLLQPLRATHAFVLATVRTSDARLDDRMQRRFTRMARDGLHLVLEPLREQDAAALVAEILGRPAPRQDLARLLVLTGGNPLYVRECALELRRSGGIEGALGTIPGTLRQVLLERVSDLPKGTRETLACAAVLGREFAATTVARMLDSLPAHAIDSLLPALRSGLVAESKPGAFSFTHALVRDAIEEALDAERRTALHARADAALASLGDSAEVLVERTRHALSALGAASAAHATALAARTIDMLEAAGSFDRAFDLAMRLAEARRSGLLPAAENDDQLRYARIARAAGHAEESRRLCQDAIARARAVGDAHALARAILFHAEDVRPGVIDRTQVTMLEEAKQALADDSSSPLYCRVIARLATALQPATDQTLPNALTREALDRARATADEDAIMYALELAPYGLYRAPLAERVSLAEELEVRALRAADLTRALSARRWLASYRVEASDFDAFDRDVDVVLSHSAEVGHPRHRWRALLLGSMRALATGRFAESDRYLTEVQLLSALVDEPSFGLSVHLHELFRARLRHASDDVATLLAALDDVLRDVVDAATMAAVLRAACAARRRDVTATRRAIDDVGTRWRSVLDSPMSMSLLAEAIALAGEGEQRGVAREVLASRPGLDALTLSDSYDGPLARLRGLLDASLGDLSAAERELREAHSLAARRGHAPWVAQIAHELSDVLSRLGREDEARRMMAECQQIASELGMTALLAEAPTETIEPSPPTSVCMEKQGALWTITRGARSITVKDSRGVQLLARLVAQQDEEIHVLTLASDEGPNIPESTAGDVLDERARKAYRERLVELEDDIAAAEHDADAGRLMKLRAERDALITELQRATGLGGRRRTAGSTTEKARVSVQKRLKDAIARVTEKDAELGRFFELSVRTGTFCRFHAY
jgi:hypothetical protein